MPGLQPRLASHHRFMREASVAIKSALNDRRMVRRQKATAGYPISAAAREIAYMLMNSILLQKLCSFDERLR
jgi:hypothetical protein